MTQHTWTRPSGRGPITFRFEEQGGHVRLTQQEVEGLLRGAGFTSTKEDR